MRVASSKSLMETHHGKDQHSNCIIIRSLFFRRTTFADDRYRKRKKQSKANAPAHWTYVCSQVCDVPRVTQKKHNRTAEGEKQAEGKKTCWLGESGTEVKRVKNTTLQTKHKDSKENALSPFWVQGSVSGRIYWPGGHLNSGRENGGEMAVQT